MRSLLVRMVPILISLLPRVLASSNLRVVASPHPRTVLVVTLTGMIRYADSCLVQRAGKRWSIRTTRRTARQL